MPGPSKACKRQQEGSSGSGGRRQHFGAAGSQGVAWQGSWVAGCCAHPLVRLCNPRGTLHTSPIALALVSLLKPPSPGQGSQAASLRPQALTLGSLLPPALAQAAAGRCPYLASGSQVAATTRDMILAHPIDIEELAKLGAIPKMWRMVIALVPCHCIAGAFSERTCVLKSSSPPGLQAAAWHQAPSNPVAD